QRTRPAPGPSVDLLRWRSHRRRPVRDVRDLDGERNRELGPDRLEQHRWRIGGRAAAARGLRARHLRRRVDRAREFLPLWLQWHGALEWDDLAVAPKPLRGLRTVSRSLRRRS